MSTPSTTQAVLSHAEIRKLAELRFQKLFEDADAMSIQGYLPDGTVVYWNRASEHIYGYSAEEALGGNLLDLIIPAEMRSGVEGAVRWMFETGQGIPASRMDLRHKNGNKVPVYSSHTVVAIPGYTPVLFCMDADMRALAQAEAELRIAATAFESQQGMVIADANGLILRVNRSFTEITGYGPSEVVGQTMGSFSVLPPAPDFFLSLQKTMGESGTWQGEIMNRRKSGEVCSDWVTFNAVRDADGTVSHVVGTLTDTTQRKEAEAKIVQLAFYDPLTSLPNRRLMQDRLHQAVSASRRKQSCGALLFVDVDDFKTLNETQGHDVGDLLLKEMARRLSNCLRDCDTAGRFGGDKFLVMLEDLGPDVNAAAAKVEAVAEKLLHELSQPYALRQLVYQGGASIGITLFTPGDVSGDELTRQAELAMYAAKALGRKTLRFFDVAMQTAVTRHAETINSLREAIAKSQFQLHYQPQIDRNGVIQGAEALLRWDRPGHGLVPPAEFIAVAENAGLILPLGAWVLETACTTLVAWARQPLLSHLCVGVNVSALQFQRADFVEQVKDILQRTGANPERLKLELTESMLVTNVEDVIAKMRALKAIGVGFALDDFGTGYSSLSYLQRLPLSELKIDRSFVQNMLVDTNSQVIVQTIIALGRSLGLSVLAEGVETASQLELLNMQDCDQVQGYHFSRPLPQRAFETFALGSQATH